MASRNKYAEIEEKELIAWLRSGDSNAVGLLYDRYSPALYGVIFRIVRSDELAEDILQEAFIKIWRSFPQFDESRGRLFTWLINIARNLAIDNYRAIRRDPTQNRAVELDVDIVDAEQNWSFNPDIIGLRELMRALKPEQLHIIERVYFGGMTLTETAEEIAIPVGTVKTRLHTALQTLRAFFRDKETHK